MRNSTITYTIPLLLLLAAFTFAACKSTIVENVVEDVEDDVFEAPGTFAASAEGSAPAKLSGTAVYGVTTNPQTGEQDFWILLYRTTGSSRAAIVFTIDGTNLPSPGTHRITHATGVGITTSTDGTMRAFYTPTPPENLHKSHSGAVTIVSQADGLLKGKFHFASACDVESTFASLLGAFNAQPAVGDISTLVNLP